MTTALEHLRWVDNLLFTTMAELPEAALTTKSGSADRTVAYLLQHIVGGAEWYRYCLSEVPWTNLAVPMNAAALDELRLHLDSMNSLLIEQATVPDESLVIEDEGGARTVTRSMLLSQAIYHSTEHRTQIACALDAAGIAGLDLDEFDLWHFFGRHGG